MKMTGEYALAAPRETVWRALNDPEVLKDCIPGCESITKLSDTEMEAAAKMKVGPVSARFKGKVTLSDLDPPNSYRISGEGSGGAAGFAKGGARVTLTDGNGGGTVLSYDVDAQVGGKLAQVGQRLVDQTAKKMADEFFSRFADKLGRAPAEAAPAEAAPAQTVPTPAPEAALAAGSVQATTLSTAPQTPTEPGPPPSAPTPLDSGRPIPVEPSPAASAPAASAAPAAKPSEAPAATKVPPASATPAPPIGGNRADTKPGPALGGASRWIAIILLILAVVLLAQYMS
nr:carbon monoxide dehydrogenase subunit G [Rhodoligotrophos defluvii]